MTKGKNEDKKETNIEVGAKAEKANSRRKAKRGRKREGKRSEEIVM